MESYTLQQLYEYSKENEMQVIKAYLDRCKTLTRDIIEMITKGAIDGNAEDIIDLMTGYIHFHDIFKMGMHKNLKLMKKIHEKYFLEIQDEITHHDDGAYDEFSNFILIERNRMELEYRQKELLLSKENKEDKDDKSLTSKLHKSLIVTLFHQARATGIIELLLNNIPQELMDDGIKIALIDVLAYKEEFNLITNFITEELLIKSLERYSSNEKFQITRKNYGLLKVLHPKVIKNNVSKIHIE